MRTKDGYVREHLFEKGFNSLFVHLIPASDFVIIRYATGPIGFLKFNTTIKEIKSIKNNKIWQTYIAVPENIDYFIRQKKVGLFRGCLLKSIHRENQKSFIPTSFVHRIAEFRDLLWKYKMTVFLYGKTLLGWKRECNIIPYATDVELAVLAEEYNEELIKVLRESKFELYSIFGKPENSLQIVVYVDRIKINLFFVYKDEHSNKSFVEGMRSATEQRLRWYTPIIEEMCAGSLLGRMIHVPCNDVQVIEALYGKKWTEYRSTSEYKRNSGIVMEEQKSYVD
ncbi:hypothetical protein FO519_007864 [Halicephalobus sp. NKZ332]|nr:hypothetical protein FO519_007864 [Halicephalobus sp. NKZ332]